MAETQALVEQYHAMLSRWLAWLRLKHALVWAGYGLMTGLAAALVLAIIATLQARVLENEFLWLALAIPAGAALLAGFAGLAFPLDRLRSVRYFDHLFGLKERTSTALELLSSNQEMQAGSEFPAHLLEDTLRVGSAVHPRQLVRPKLKPRHWIPALLLIAAIAGVWMLGKPYFHQALQQRMVQQSIAEEAQKVASQIEAIQKNDRLSEAQKVQLAQPLEEALKGLQDSKSLEEAVSVLHSTEDKLQALDSQQTQEMAQSLQQAGQSLAGQEGSPLQTAGESLAAGDPNAAATDLQNLDLSSMSQEQLNQLASTLDELASILDATNPELANQLRQAVKAARGGDAQAAQAALNQAAQSLSQASGQIAQGQAAQQAANAASQSQASLLEAGRRAQQANAQGQGQSQGQRQGQGQGSGSNQANNSGQGTGGGAGRGEGTGSENSQGAEAGTNPIETGNGPGDAGERPYEQVYSPQHLGGEGGPDVSLPQSGNPGEVIGQAPTAPGTPGQSTVPYVDVFPSYADAYRQAIESGEIPLYFRSLVRKYFSTLQP